MTRYLSSSTFCFVFSSEKEAVRFLNMKKWWCFRVPLFLDKWHPLGCSSKNFRQPSNRLLRVMWLPLHLWGEEVFHAIGNRCGGFLAIDEDTQAGEELRWVRILIKGNLRLPKAVTVRVGGWVFRLPIWVEDVASCYFRG